MSDPYQDFIKTVAAMRQAVIKSGGKPDKIYVSKQAIESMKLFGMKIEVSPYIPKDVSVFVLDSNRYKPENIIKEKL